MQQVALARTKNFDSPGLKTQTGGTDLAFKNPPVKGSGPPLVEMGIGEFRLDRGYCAVLSSLN